MSVPDSSVTNAAGARFDGMRLLTACSSEHLGRLRDQYAQRPFVEAELWAGRMLHVMRQYPPLRGVELERDSALSQRMLGVGALGESVLTTRMPQVSASRLLMIGWTLRTRRPTTTRAGAMTCHDVWKPFMARPPRVQPD